MLRVSFPSTHFSYHSIRHELVVAELDLQSTATTTPSHRLSTSESDHLWCCIFDPVESSRVQSIPEMSKAVLPCLLASLLPPAVRVLSEKRKVRRKERRKSYRTFLPFERKPSSLDVHIYGCHLDFFASSLLLMPRLETGPPRLVPEILFSVLV